MDTSSPNSVFGEVPVSDAPLWDLVEMYMAPILKYFIRDDVTEIMVNRYDKIFIDCGDGVLLCDERFEDEAHLERFITQLATALDQPFDRLNPILNARFPNQSRACCTSRAVSPGGATVTIRVVPKRQLSATDLVASGACSEDMMAYLKRATVLGAKIFLSGNTGSGKTTILRILSGFIPNVERVITVEDTQELFVALGNIIHLEAPIRNGNDDRHLTLSDLIEAALRMLPDRLIVGELRSSAACHAILQAMNTGHHGCCATLHANSCADAIKRIQYLIASAGFMDYELAGKQLSGAINIVVQCQRAPDGSRRIVEIAEFIDDHLTMMFSYDSKKGSFVDEANLASSCYAT